MTYAVHSIHAPAVKVEGGTYTLNGRDRIKVGDPIYTADTIEAAESWRMDAIRNRFDVEDGNG